MTHTELTQQVYEIRQYFPEVEYKTWEYIYKLDDDTLMEYIEANERYLNDRLYDLNLNA